MAYLKKIEHLKGFGVLEKEVPVGEELYLSPYCPEKYFPWVRKPMGDTKKDLTYSPKAFK